MTTEELLKLLSDPAGPQSYFANGYGYVPRWTDVGGYGTGQDYVPGQKTFDGYTQIQAGKGMVGDPYQIYDAQGNLKQNATITADSSFDKLMEKATMAFLAATAGGAAMSGMGLGGFGAPGAESTGVTGLPSGADASMFYADPGAASSMGGYSTTGALGTMQPLELLDLSTVPANMSPMALSRVGAAAGGAAGGAAGAGGAGAAGASLIPGISDKALGLGATVLGGVLGSQETPGQTAERKMDPRLDAYVYGTNGLVPVAAGLLASQMPQAQQVGQQLNTIGTGLLGQGIAPNGFERFTKGRY